MDKVKTVEEAALLILDGKIESAKTVIEKKYPFKKINRDKRKYTDSQKMLQFAKDGFIDRYSGQKLLNPGLLKVLSFYLTDDFPYHPHGKMDQCHNAYWELYPTVDHIYPIALGGNDSSENWVTTSMLHNSIKSNWTIEQLNWKLFDPGKLEDWDGLTKVFLDIVDRNMSLLNDIYINKWYRLSKMI